MFCRKCGTRIHDDSAFCFECGTKVEILPQTPVSDNAGEAVSLPEAAHDSYGNPVSKNSRHKIIIAAAGIAAAIVLLIVIICSSTTPAKCEYYRDCANPPAEGSDYCTYHRCEYYDCDRGKSYGGNYCYTHQCASSLCYNVVSSGSQYCSKHTCDAEGCYKEVKVNSPNCAEHQIDMRTRLGYPTINFSLNSAGGIKFTFYASNKSGKTIKYVRFKVYLKNAVGDAIKEDITGDYYVDVEIIGPIKNGKNVYMSSEIIGYCDNLARVDIRDITLVYTDGTSETGSFNYYYSR